ncbi:MAG: J domain-containing protein [Bdellovibrionales bacterium]|nr:J domain-containing protein [Bdellovibrionales bacterium]
MNLKWVADHFQTIQFLIIIGTIIFAWVTFKSPGRGSQFRNREADRADLEKFKTDSGLADARFRKSPPPLSLPGVRISGEPHEILGIRADANEEDVMKAYKDAIKRYHPDKIQGLAQDQIQFYQNASAKINEAKDAMIKKIRGTA